MKVHRVIEWIYPMSFEYEKHSFDNPGSSLDTSPSVPRPINIRAVLQTGIRAFLIVSVAPCNA